MFSKKNWVLLLIAFIVFNAFLVNYLYRVPQRHYCDYRVYYKAGQDLIKGKNIYVRDREDVTPYKYSPFFACVFAPLSLPPIKVSASIFLAINFVLTCLFFKLSFELVQSSGIAASLSSTERLLIYALTCICSMRYIWLVWYSGQVSILMCALVVIALSFLSKGRVVWAGAFFAASILIKYTPALFLPYLFLKRKFSAVFGAVFFIGLFLMLPALIVGFEKNILYLSSWFPSIIATSLDKVSFIDLKNQSIFSMFLRFFSPTMFNVNILSLSFDQVLLYGRVAALLLYLLIFIPGRCKARDGAIDTALLMICMSLFNPNGWMINFVSLIPSYMLLIQYTIVNKGKDRFVLFSLIAAFIITNIMSKELTGSSGEDFGCYYSFTTLGALILYAALLKLKFSQDLPKTIQG